jgi:predicted small secreted protein
MSMMNFKKSAAIVLVAGVLMAGLSGCKKEEGPAERAGKAVDNAVQKAGEQVEKAGEKIQDAAKDAKK